MKANHYSATASPGTPSTGKEPRKEPFLISYIRFSTLDQAKGHSEERQSQAAEEWAAEKGLTLKTYMDKGVSGHSGANRKRGALSILLAEIRAGKIPSGSYLVIENIDRLTREHPLDSIEIVKQILAAGVRIVILRTKVEYTEESLRGDQGQLLGLVLELGRACGESDRKSDLISKAWLKKRKMAAETKEPIGNFAPGWLRCEGVKGCRRYVVVEERAKLVQEIFEMSANGKGQYVIAKELNGLKVPCWRGGKFWRSSFVNRILNDRAVLGEFHPCTYVPKVGKDGEKRMVQQRVGEPIAGYYPVIIDAELWQRSRPRKPRAKGDFSKVVSNLFVGIAYEADTGAKITYMTNLPKDGVRHGYFVADATGTRWPYNVTEYAILTTLAELDWRAISGEGRPMEERLLTSRVAELELQLQTLETALENLTKSLSIKVLKSIVDKIEETELEIETVGKELGQARRALASFQNSSVQMDGFKLPESAFDPYARDARLPLRAEIARRVERIELHRKTKAGKQPYAPFNVTIRFANGVYRWIRITPRYKQRPLVSAAAFQAPNPDAPDILALPPIPGDSSDGD